MSIKDTSLFPQYHDKVGKYVPDWFEAYDFAAAEANPEYQLQASAVFSSNIEGNRVDINSFMNSITAKTPFKPGKEVAEIQDLVKAYDFARQHELTEKNLLAAHKIMSRTLLTGSKQGKYRTDRMGVFDHSGMVYMAIEPEKVKTAMKVLFKDITDLLKTPLSVEAAFFHAALLHLKLAHIHPFWDGNGRMARLLEKWLLASAINGRAWLLPSERFYKEHLEAYYRNINLGMDYYSLDYGQSLLFLVMLPGCLRG